MEYKIGIDPMHANNGTIQLLLYYCDELAWFKHKKFKENNNNKGFELFELHQERYAHLPVL